MVSRVFNENTKLDADKILNAENKELFGIESGSISGRQDKLGILARQFQSKAQANRAKASRADTAFWIDWILDVAGQYEQDFIDKYGEDYVFDLGAKYLSEEELSGLKTEEEIRQAIIDKYFDDDGNLIVDGLTLEQEQELRKFWVVDKAEEFAKSKPTMDEVRDFTDKAGLHAKQKFVDNAQSLSQATHVKEEHAKVYDNENSFSLGGLFPDQSS